jgi:hypothetical protein
MQADQPLAEYRAMVMTATERVRLYRARARERGVLLDQLAPVPASYRPALGRIIATEKTKLRSLAAQARRRRGPEAEARDIQRAIDFWTALARGQGLEAVAAEAEPAETASAA